MTPKLPSAIHDARLTLPSGRSFETLGTSAAWSAASGASSRAVRRNSRFMVWFRCRSPMPILGCAPSAM